MFDGIEFVSKHALVLNIVFVGILSAHPSNFFFIYFSHS